MNGSILPPGPAVLADLSRTGADSVFRYLARTAKVTPKGVCCQTLDSTVSRRAEAISTATAAE